jgi:ABC-type branched-subunit amino acid transport system permease subunit
MEAERPLARGTADPLLPLFVLVVGAGLLVLVLAHPAVDESWENHPAHFWLVLTAAALNVALGYAVGVAARRRRDARLLLVQIIGDAVMVIFNQNGDQPDHAQRAARTALAFQAAATEIAERTPAGRASAPR